LVLYYSLLVVQWENIVVTYEMKIRRMSEVLSMELAHSCEMMVSMCHSKRSNIKKKI